METLIRTIQKSQKLRDVKQMRSNKTDDVASSPSSHHHRHSREELIARVNIRAPSIPPSFNANDLLNDVVSTDYIRRSQTAEIFPAYYYCLVGFPLLACICICI